MKKKTMTLEECQGCKYLIKIIALGLGVRCRHPENQKYKLEDEILPHMPVIISRIPSPCSYRDSSEKKS